MEVNLNVNSAGPVAKASPQPKSKVQSGSSDAVEFSGADALNQTLGTTPEIRPEAVANARELISQPNYPPLETIRKIAALLAFNIGRSDSGL